MWNIALRAAIERASFGGELRYTERQLYYELCRTLLPHRRLVRRWRWGLLAGGAFSPWIWRAGRRDVARLLALGGIAALTALLPHTPSPPLTYKRYQQLLRSYLDAGGAAPGLLIGPPRPALPLADLAPELADYGIEHLLVCQSAEIAALLLANDFHLLASCAVIALDEATPLPPPLLAMLARGTRPTIYLLHDWSPAGIALGRGLRTRLGAPASVRLLDIGLSADQARTLTPALAGEGRVRACWSVRAVEVSALPPHRLLRGLRRIVRGEPVRRGWRSWLADLRGHTFLAWPEEAS